MKKSLIGMKGILWRTFSLLGVLFLGLFISGCSDSKITSDQIGSVMIDFGDGLLLSGEKEALLKVSKEPNFVSYFGTKDVISIGQFGSVRLDNKMGYQYTINNDQNFWLFIRSSYKSEIEHSSGYVVDCSKDSPYYKEVDLGSGIIAMSCDGDTGKYKNDIINEILIPTEVTDIIIEEGNKQTVIKGETGERLERVKKGP